MLIAYVVAAYIIIGAVKHSDSRILQRVFKLFAECDFCLGVWVFFALSPIFQVTLFERHVPVVTEFITAIILSWVAHRLRISEEMIVYESTTARN